MKSLLLILLLPVLVFAQFTTPNTGVNWSIDSLVLYSGGVVTGSGAVYSMTNVVNISASDRITLTPGITITVSGPTSGFQVNGVLRSIGTPTAPITFTALVPDSLGPYNGLQFNDSAVDSLCIVKYNNISFAYYGVRCIGASPAVENNIFFKCRRGVQLSASNSLIKGNRIERSYEYGITMTLGSSPRVEGNYLLNNNSQNTSAKNQISIGTQNDNSPKVIGNTIEGGMFNKTGGISISGLLGTSLTSEIINNRIFNNSFGIALGGSGINTIVKGNTIENNNINPDVMTSGSGINVNGTATNSPVITENTIRGNWWGITIQNGTTIQAGPMPNLGNLANTSISDDGYNNIYNNVQGTAVQDLFNNCTNAIFAQNNYWGTNDPAVIEQHITHRVDDTTRGLVDFSSFRPTFVPVELSSFSVSVSNNSCEIHWQTVTETNSQLFTVLKNNGNRWIELAVVPGAGTTTLPRRYSITDPSPGSSHVIYRLQQTDFDGTTIILAEKEVTIQPLGFTVSQNFPNPFNPSSVIEVTVPSDAGNIMSVSVFSVTGKEVFSQQTAVLSGTTQRITLAPGINMPNLSSGTYFYTVRIGSYQRTVKLMYLK